MTGELILIVDDEQSIRQSLVGVLEDEGYRTLCAEDGVQALELLTKHLPDLVLLDIWMPKKDGLQTLSLIKTTYPALEVIMISGHGNIETAVKSTKLGAFDFLEKPLALERVLLQIRNALDHAKLLKENLLLKQRVVDRYRIIGDSQAMIELNQIIQRAGPTNGRVLISGESGTGKELIARRIHLCSHRSDREFIEVNCAAIPDELIESELFGYEKGAFTGALATKIGKFELAHGGTLFLDEIGDMSLKTQAKVLRVLEEKTIQRIGGNSSIPIDVRIIAASNKQLSEQIEVGNFRDDLFYRLNVIPITAPPLRHHKEDIPALINHFLDTFAEEYGRRKKELEPEALTALIDYSWPGNVRELKNTIERLVIMTPTHRISLNELTFLQHPDRSTPSLRATVSLKEARDDFERQLILDELTTNQWNIPRTAERLGIERSNFYKKLKSLGISLPSTS